MEPERRRKREANQLQAQLNEWKAELDRLEGRLSTQDAEIRPELERRMIALRVECEEIRRRLNDIAGTAERDVNVMAGKTRDRWERLKRGVTDLLSQFGVDGMHRSGGGRILIFGARSR